MRKEKKGKRFLCFFLGSEKKTKNTPLREKKFNNTRVVTSQLG